MKITIKSTLLPPPGPGSRFLFRTDADGESCAFWSMTGVEPFTIDWGDGTVESFSSGNYEKIIHTYAQRGERWAEITDGISTLRLSGNSDFTALYSHRLLRFETDAPRCPVLTSSGLSRPTSRPNHPSRPEPQLRAAVRHLAQTPLSHRLNLPYSVGIAATALFSAAIFSW